MKEKLLILKNGLIVLIAILSFLHIMILPLMQMGFTPSYIHTENELEPFLSRSSLWIINMILGIVLGLCLNPKDALIAGFSAWVASVAITGSALLYFSFRTNVMAVEMILPLIPGLIGLNLYDYLIAKKRKQSQNSA